jgi:predicted RND superfamily exporter protein
MPTVDEHFFFSSDDPLLQVDKKIAKIFPQPPQLILAARGDIRSGEYVRKVEGLCQELESLPLVFSVQSIVRGPDDVEDALKSPLWGRVLVSGDHRASFIVAFLKKDPDSGFIREVEKIRERFSAPGFELMVSGIPYIVERIRRNLFQDLQVFSLVSFLVFSLSLFILFRSLWIVAGVIVSCFNASALTMIVAEFARIDVGFLTANLPMIVFVLTLSHIAFLTADWKERITGEGQYRSGLGWQAARATLEPALWSTFTALLGFLTLLFVQAKSLRQLGITGSIGTLLALGAAYGIYPWFLERQKRKPEFLQAAQFRKGRIAAFFTLRHRNVLFILLVLSIFCLAGLPKLNTDPSLFDYFKKGSELRNGLEYIDGNSGSNPVNLVIEDPEHNKLNDREAYKKMWKLHLALEKDPAVGKVVSLPIVLAEAKRSFLTRLLTTEWLLDVLESRRFGEIAKYFVTANREKTLFFVPMKEENAERPRLKTVERIKNIVRENGYNPVLMGGVFVLQGRLSELLASSLISGSGILNAAILIMTWLLSRSWKTALAMLVSLYFVPVTMLGILSLMKIPLDVIAAPAANVAIGMGVDSMIHLMAHARRLEKGPNDWKAWAKACSHLWDPILWSTLIVIAGFTIFTLSNFPPTQRFGFSVVLGSVLSPLATLFILPWLATLSIKGNRSSPAASP